MPCRPSAIVQGLVQLDIQHETGHLMGPGQNPALNCRGEDGMGRGLCSNSRSNTDTVLQGVVTAGMGNCHRLGSPEVDSEKQIGMQEVYLGMIL